MTDEFNLQQYESGGRKTPFLRENGPPEGWAAAPPIGARFGVGSATFPGMRAQVTFAERPPSGLDSPSIGSVPPSRCGTGSCWKQGHFSTGSDFNGAHGWSAGSACTLSIV